MSKGQVFGWVNSKGQVRYVVCRYVVVFRCLKISKVSMRYSVSEQYLLHIADLT